MVSPVLAIICHDHLLTVLIIANCTQLTVLQWGWNLYQRKFIASSTSSLARHRTWRLSESERGMCKSPLPISHSLRFAMHSYSVGSSTMTAHCTLGVGTLQQTDVGGPTLQARTKHPTPARSPTLKLAAALEPTSVTMPTISCLHDKPHQSPCSAAGKLRDASGPAR